jgi:DNA-binding transcriptional ArsR family regulator
LTITSLGLRKEAFSRREILSMVKSVDEGTHVKSVEDPEGLQALAHPVRVQVLEALREPSSAANVARRIGHPRQNVNYHVKELQRAGLVRQVGERRKGNFVEQLYQAVATTFVVSPRAVWGDPRRTQAMRDQFALERLVHLGERLERDAAVLLDRAAFDGDEIASASVDVEVRFASEADRAAFLDEYLATVGPLLEKYGHRDGLPYRVALVAYPDPEVEEGG